jgi:hypothetical protein
MRVVIALFIILAAPVAFACTTCASVTGEAVRAGIFNDAFVRTFFEVLAPFPIFGLVVYALNRRLPE